MKKILGSSALCLLYLCTRTASEFSNFEFITSIQFAHPAFLDFVNLRNEDTIDLSVTVFSASAPGQVSFIKNISTIFSSVDPDEVVNSLNVDTIADQYLWPNILSEIPDSALSDEKRKKLCGGSDCTVMTLGDGFLVPGKQTGAIYLQAVHVPGQANLTPAKISVDEKFWYYHNAYWADMDGDGLLDMIAGRAYTNNIGQSNGQLVWFKQPSRVEDIAAPWPMQVLTDGPDILLSVTTSTESTGSTAAGDVPQYVTVIAPEFWGERLSVTTIEVGINGPKVASYEIVDEELGAGYGIYNADVDGDGEVEVVVNNHEHKDGSVFAYEIKSTPPGTETTGISTTVQRHTMSSDFLVTKFGPNEAAPGFLYQIPASTNIGGKFNASAAQPWWLVAGDGSEGVHIMYPSLLENDPYVYTSEKIIEVGGTVGSLALLPLEDGALGVAVPNYDNGQILFYRFFGNASGSVLGTQ